jgi:hypothetical protein
MQHSNLVGHFVSYEEKEMLCLMPQELYPLLFIFLVAYECAQKASVTLH